MPKYSNKRSQKKIFQSEEPLHKQGYGAKLWKFRGKKLRFKLNGGR